MTLDMLPQACATFDDWAQTLLDAPLARDVDAPSLQRQLHTRLRTAILGGRLLPGSRLPGTRALAQSLGARLAPPANPTQGLAVGLMRSWN